MALSAGWCGPVATGMEFCLLGPLIVRRAEVVLPVARGKQRAVLAALLLDAGRAVSVDDLTEVLWGTRPPPSARVTVQNHVKRLRHTMGEADRARISTEPRGYAISVDAGELDVTRFEALLESARAAAREDSWDTAARQARGALSLWRGDPLADVESDVLAAREVPRLAELRLQAVEARIDADLRMGRHAEVVSELQQLVGTHQLREHFHAQLMLALYRCGRQAEALEAYRTTRTLLISELGVEPGAEIRGLHQGILGRNQKRDLALSPEAGLVKLAGTVGYAPLVVPRQLPADVTAFTGRARELAELDRLLAVGERGDVGGGSAPAVISAITGTAGVGKTALAVRWAHQVAERFPDGQLYLNMRGYDPGQPMPAPDALAGFLRTLGVPGRDIPAEEEERAALYRSLLAGRRMLVVLDNASEVEQVRPLLPGAAGCVVAVTSRDSLGGLVARHGAARLDLDLLPLPDAVGMLQALIGSRVDDDPAAAAALADRCSRLPLALRLAAELAAARSPAPVRELVGELADQQRRLELLDAGGDPRTAVREVFSWSYRHLDADAARAFRLVGLHPGSDWDSYAAAALAGITVNRADRMLGLLARAHLIRPAGVGRYGMHDLLRDYGAEQAARDDAELARRAALTRLFDYYVHTAAAAIDTLNPAELHRRPRFPATASPAPTVTDPVTAQAWLDAELATLVAVSAHTAEHGWPDHATGLAATLYHYLDTCGHYPEAVIIHGHARSAARQAGDRAAEATALTNLGAVDARQGQCQRAAGHLQQALDLFRDTGDQAGQARVLISLGIVDERLGLYQQAAERQRQALALFLETGDRVGEARALGNLGIVAERLGHYRQAAGHLKQALALCRETGDRVGEVRALGNLGCVDSRLGRYQQAAGHQRQALALCRETGDRVGEAHVLTELGVISGRQGRYQQAVGYLCQAIALFREISDRHGEAEALNGLGETLLAAGQPSQARTRHAAALGLASQIGGQYQRARALSGLGCAHHAVDDLNQARSYWREALTVYTDLGAPEARTIRGHLTGCAP
jgi:DNA-binding SARP family transcriptional activator/tetratricopeptide (TPR) repeat protein